MPQKLISHEEEKNILLTSINARLLSNYAQNDISFVPPQNPDTIRINNENLFYELAENLGINKIGRQKVFGMSRSDVNGGLSYILNSENTKVFNIFLDGCIVVCLDAKKTDAFVDRYSQNYTSSKEFYIRKQ